MTLREVGAYITLLAHCWLDGGLSTDPRILARLLRLSPSAFATLWAGPLGQCFIEFENKLVNPRLEVENQKQRAYREAQSTRAAKRWEKQHVTHAEAVPAHTPGSASAMQSVHDSGNALHLQSSSAVFDLRSKSVRTKNVSLEPAQNAASEPAVLDFPVVGTQGTYGLSAQQVADWSTAFPGLDVLQEARAAKAWILADLSRRKTARGMPRFLVAWLSRAVNGRRASGPVLVADTRPVSAVSARIQSTLEAAAEIMAAPDVRWEDVR